MTNIAKLGVYDCFEGRAVVVSKTPFVIGSAAGCDLRIPEDGVARQHCVIQQRNGSYFLTSAPGVVEVLLDGMAFAGGEISPNEEHTLIVGSRCMVLRWAPQIEQWLQRMDGSQWFTYQKATQAVTGPFALGEVGDHLRSLPGQGVGLILACQGLTSMGFYVEHILPLLPGGRGRPAAGPPPVPVEAEAGGGALEALTGEHGEFTCPVCWLRFDRGDVMSVAVHASLRGDPLLGTSEMQRFYATRFNDRGQALDAMGISAPDLACPHCRRRLPQGFLDLPNFIFSIVGAPSSGKSYYLSVLVKVLQNSLFEHFGVIFRDADPSANALLNAMKNQLFSAATPAEAMLAKTELEGGMYEVLPRLGRKVALPRPFIFNLSVAGRPQSDSAIVFYDNAGEHFEPNSNSADSPGAQHIAAASGIFFLFDPLYNIEFRKRLAGGEDPQLGLNRTDQQDVILAETEVRIKNIMGLRARDRIRTPLAMMVGKLDAWGHLLGSEPLEPVLRTGALDAGAVRRNSARIRTLLMGIVPAIVANAEAISEDVCYFAISPLGSAPVQFADARGNRMIGPDPARVAPKHVDVPTLWMLSRVTPGLVGTHHPS